jgi:hypothetical protein
MCSIAKEILSTLTVRRDWPDCKQELRDFGYANYQINPLSLPGFDPWHDGSNVDGQ